MSADQSQEAWLATFSDLAALLLAFFVMTFSMATMESKAISVETEPQQTVGELAERNALLADVVALTANLDVEVGNHGIRAILLQQRWSDFLDGIDYEVRSDLPNAYVLRATQLDSSLIEEAIRTVTDLGARLILISPGRLATEELLALLQQTQFAQDRRGSSDARIALLEVSASKLRPDEVAIAVRLGR